MNPMNYYCLFKRTITPLLIFSFISVELPTFRLALNSNLSSTPPAYLDVIATGNRSRSELRTLFESPSSWRIDLNHLPKTPTQQLTIHLQKKGVETAILYGGSARELVVGSLTGESSGKVHDIDLLVAVQDSTLEEMTSQVNLIGTALGISFSAKPVRGKWGQIPIEIIGIRLPDGSIELEEERLTYLNSGLQETINSFQVMPDGTVIDPYNARQDLENGILRIIAEHQTPEQQRKAVANFTYQQVFRNIRFGYELAYRFRKTKPLKSFVLSSFLEDVIRQYFARENFEPIDSDHAKELIWSVYEWGTRAGSQPNEVTRYLLSLGASNFLNKIGVNLDNITNTLEAERNFTDQLMRNGTFERFHILKKYIERAWAEGTAEMVERGHLNESEAERFKPNETFLIQLTAVIMNESSRSARAKAIETFLRNGGFTIPPKFHIMTQKLLQTFDQVWILLTELKDISFPPRIDSKIQSHFLNHEEENRVLLNRLLAITYQSDAAIHLLRNLIAIYLQIEQFKIRASQISEDDFEDFKLQVQEWTNLWFKEVKSDRFKIRLDQKTTAKSLELFLTVEKWIRDFAADIEDADQDEIVEILKDLQDNLDHLNSEENGKLYNNLAFEVVGLYREFEAAAASANPSGRSQWAQDIADTIRRFNRSLYTQTNWPSLGAYVERVANESDSGIRETEKTEADKSAEMLRLKFFEGVLYDYGHLRSIRALANAQGFQIRLLELDREFLEYGERLKSEQLDPDAEVYLQMIFEANNLRFLLTENKFPANAAPQAITQNEIYAASREAFTSWWFRTERQNLIELFNLDMNSIHQLFDKIEGELDQFAAQFSRTNSVALRAAFRESDSYEDLENMIEKMVQDSFEPMRILSRRLFAIFTFVENHAAPHMANSVRELYYGDQDGSGGINKRYEDTLSKINQLIIRSFIKLEASRYKKVASDATVAVNLLSTFRMGKSVIRETIARKATEGTRFIEDSNRFPFVNPEAIASVFPSLNGEFFEAMKEIFLLVEFFQSEELTFEGNDFILDAKGAFDNLYTALEKVLSSNTAAPAAKSELRIARKQLTASFLGLISSLTPIQSSAAIERAVTNALVHENWIRTQIKSTVAKELNAAGLIETNENVGAIVGNELVFANGGILLLPALADMFGAIVVIAPTQVEEQAIHIVRSELREGQKIITAKNYNSARAELRKLGFTSEHVIVSETDPILTIKQWAARVTIFSKKKIGELLSGLETAAQQIQAELRIAYAA